MQHLEEVAQASPSLVDPLMTRPELQRKALMGWSCGGEHDFDEHLFARFTDLGFGHDASAG